MIMIDAEREQFSLAEVRAIAVAVANAVVDEVVVELRQNPSGTVEGALVRGVAAVKQRIADGRL